MHNQKTEKTFARYKDTNKESNETRLRIYVNTDFYAYY